MAIIKIRNKALTLLDTANGKIAGENLDVSFENITDTGTEGTRVASGTTAQRGSTTGQWRFNTTTGYFEGRTSAGEFQSLEPQPSITSVDTTAIDITGSTTLTIRLTGVNFLTGGVIKFIGNDSSEITASTSTFINSTTYDAVVTRSDFTNAKEPYDVKYIGTTGITATLDNAINVDTSPTWTTSSGSLGTIFSNDTGNHFTIQASDADGDTISYSETATVLSGQNLTLNSSTGVISGDPTDVSSDTTLSFTGRATANSKNVDRAFSIILRPPKTVDTFDIFSDSSALALYNLNSNGNDLGGNYNANVGSNITFQSSGGKYGGYAQAGTTGGYANGVTYYGDGLSNQLKPSTNFSYSWWFKNPSSNFTAITVHGSECFWYFRTSNNQINVRHYNTGSSTNINFTGSYTDSGGWNHAVVTNPSGTGNTKLYVNNSLIGQASSTTSTTSYQESQKRITITPDEGTATNIDQVRIFNKEISSTEVSTLYNEVG